MVEGTFAHAWPPFLGPGGTTRSQRRVLLTGGLGGAHLAPTLAEVLGEQNLAVVVNVGDDLDWHGLRVCPDLDTVLYALGGHLDRERGWGRVEETFTTTDALASLGRRSGSAWVTVTSR